MKELRSLILNLSIKFTATIIIFALFCSLTTYAQEQKDLGVGTFSLTYSFYPKGVMPTDTTSNIILKRNYYIKHSKVIVKTIGPPAKEKRDTISNIYQDGDLQIKSQMSAKVLYPTYLADYKNQQYFMFFDDTKDKFYLQDSLKNHPEDIYNPKKVADRKAPVITVDEKVTYQIAGKKCFKGYSTSGSDTSTFYFTKEKLNFVSPLNPFAVIDYSVLGVRLKQPDGSIYGLFIVNIKDEEMPDAFFKIPATAQQKTWAEVMSSTGKAN